MGRPWTVGGYLVRRIEQAGVKHVFGVPGDYVLGFLDCLVAGDLELIGTCNELNAGYAADAYARIKGVGAAVVTYDVGGLSVLNAIAGSHAERVPVIVISGAPATTESKHPHVLHHTTGNLDIQLNVFRTVIGTAVRLDDPRTAPEQIDEVIATCLREQRPVYLELPMDVVKLQCRAPGRFAPSTALPIDEDALAEAVEETAALLQAAPSVVVMAGIEARRLACYPEMQLLIEHLGCPFVTTCLSKTVLPEDHPQFAGVYVARMGKEGPRLAVEDAGMILSLGNLMTDFDLGFYTARLQPSRLVIANSDKVRVKHHTYDRVSLVEFINALRRRLPAGLCAPPMAGEHGAEAGGKMEARAGGATPAPATAGPVASAAPMPSPVPDVAAEPGRITLSRFFERIGALVGPRTTVVADIGAAALGASDLFMPSGSLYLSQAFYMSIGWSVPAALGAAFAAPASRVLAFVGDGAFQFTAQELSSIIRYERNPVLFVLNNSGYTVERVIHDGPFNDIQAWHYSRLPVIFGGAPGHVVQTEDDLEQAMASIQANEERPTVIEVQIDPMDIAEGMKGLVAIGGRSVPQSG